MSDVLLAEATIRLEGVCPFCTRTLGVEFSGPSQAKEAFARLTERIRRHHDSLRIFDMYPGLDPAGMPPKLPQGDRT